MTPLSLVQSLRSQQTVVKAYLACSLNGPIIVSTTLVIGGGRRRLEVAEKAEGRVEGALILKIAGENFVALHKNSS